jgi:hypothetical protein
LVKAVKTEKAKDAKQAQYRVKSALFYRRRSSFIEAVRLLDSIDPDKLKWDNHEDIGISQKAIDTVRANGIPLERVFCNPMVILKEPKLLLYYRSVAAVPQKGIRLFGADTTKYERGESVAPNKAVDFSKTINSFITDLIENDPKFTMEDIKTVSSMTYGSQLEGSWRNIVGEEGEQRIKQILMAFLRGKNVITSIIMKDSKQIPPSEPFDIDEVLQINLANGYWMKFGSDPDVSLFDPKSKLVAVVEIKGGLDPAGALERYGAAKKSFDDARRRNKSADTVYVALLTDTVQKRIKKDAFVTQEYELTDVYAGKQARTDFLERMLWLAHLS